MKIKTGYVIAGIAIVLLIAYATRSKAATRVLPPGSALPPGTNPAAIPSGWVRDPRTGEYVPGYPGYIPPGVEQRRHDYIQAKIIQIMTLPGYDTFRKDRLWMSRNGFAIEVYNQADKENPYGPNALDSYYNYNYPGVEAIPVEQRANPSASSSVWDWLGDNWQEITQIATDIFTGSTPPPSGGSFSTNTDGELPTGTLEGDPNGGADYSDLG